MASINELFEKLSSDLASLANAIRAKTGKADTLGIEDMATEQDAVFDAGKKAEYDRFWDLYQQNGTRAAYNYAFSWGYGWTDDTYTPKYPIAVTGKNRIANLFYYNSSVTDTKVEISILQIPANDSQPGEATDVFNSATALRTIRKLTVDGLTTFTRTFYKCAALENLTIGGTIGQNGFDVSACTKLTHDSLMSIINALEAKTSGTWTVTLGTTNLAKLTDAEKAIATQKGWTLA